MAWDLIQRGGFDVDLAAFIDEFCRQLEDPQLLLWSPTQEGHNIGILWLSLRANPLAAGEESVLAPLLLAGLRICLLREELLKFAADALGEPVHPNSEGWLDGRLVALVESSDLDRGEEDSGRGVTRE